MSEKIGEIKAQIIERDGQVWMVKDCPIHGHYEDLMAIDANFLKWINRSFPAATFPRTMTKTCTSTVLRPFVTAAALFLPSTLPTAAT